MCVRGSVHACVRCFSMTVNGENTHTYTCTHTESESERERDRQTEADRQTISSFLYFTFSLPNAEKRGKEGVHSTHSALKGGKKGFPFSRVKEWQRGRKQGGGPPMQSFLMKEGVKTSPDRTV
mmetsp:Transcript_11940/g.22919  ORF Transcript_11940/g.22919 Transcript_11940/m.22919 type:complete len:123 (+) Transcript_11940:142-510(+)